jgi:hypothetical protein
MVWALPSSMPMNNLLRKKIKWCAELFRLDGVIPLFETNT